MVKWKILPGIYTNVLAPFNDIDPSPNHHPCLRRMSNDQTHFGAIPASHVGGHARPRYLFGDPFASPILTPGATSRVGSEDAPMAPLRQCRFCSFGDEGEDGPISDIRQEDMIGIRRKYSLPDLVELRCAG